MFDEFDEVNNLANIYLKGENRSCAKFRRSNHFKALSNSQFKPDKIISEVSISWLEIFRYCKRSFLFFFNAKCKATR